MLLLRRRRLTRFQLSRRRTVIVAFCAAAIAAGGLLGTSVDGRKDRTYVFIQPRIPAGMTLRQSAETVEKRVLNDLGSRAHLNSVRVVGSRSDIGKFVVGLGQAAPQERKGGLTWIIRAYGLFKPVTVPPGAPEVTTARTGWVIVDDASGQSIGYGWP
jgi:hypothetical protein